MPWRQDDAHARSFIAGDGSAEAASKSGLAAALSLHAQVQSMTMQCALTGDRGLLRQVILTDPLVAATMEPHEADALTEELLEVNARYLPQFASSIGGAA